MDLLLGGEDGKGDGKGDGICDLQMGGRGITGATAGLLLLERERLRKICLPVGPLRFTHLLVLGFLICSGGQGCKDLLLLLERLRIRLPMEPLRFTHRPVDGFRTWSERQGLRLTGLLLLFLLLLLERLRIRFPMEPLRFTHRPVAGFRI
jgi:hypothetical protein